MRTSFVVAAVTALGIGVGVIALRPGSEQTIALDSSPDSAQIPEFLGTPEGPFDPVVMKPPSNPRFLPPANKVVNNPSGDTANSVQSETAIWVAGDEIVVGWNDAMGFFGAESISGYGYSNDRGETWTDGGAMPATGSIAPFGDPTVVRTSDGTWVFASIDQGSPNGVSIHRSSFVGGSITWPAPTKFSDGGTFIDKEFLAYDEATNTIYLAYINFGTNLFRISSSTDSGASWSTPTTVSPSNGGNGAYPIPGIDGEVYVSWIRPLFQPNGEVRIRYSPDGGATFPDPVRLVETLGPDSDERPQCFNRGSNITFPSFDVDRSNGPHRGRLYGCWADGGAGDFDVWFTYSDDKGVTWAPFVKINDNDETVDTSEQFIPQLRVSETDGRVLIGWYDRRNDSGGASLCDFYVAQSQDGGAYWGPNRRMSDTSVAWCGVPADIAPNFGDYVAVFVDDLSSFAVWADGRNGNPDVIFSKKNDRLAMSGSSGGNALAGTFWPIPDVAEFCVDPEPAYDTVAQFGIASLGAAMFATPQEDSGILSSHTAGVPLEITLTSVDGEITGTTFSEETGDHDVNLDFEFGTVTGDFSAIPFTGTWSTSVSIIDVDSGVGQISGTMTFDTFGFPYVFTVSGFVDIVGDHTPIYEFDYEQDARYTVGDGCLRTKTRVTGEGGVIGVDDDEPVVLGDNPFPQVLVHSAPNPWQPSTRISYTIDRPVEGAIRVYNARGQLVRTLAEGRFEPGDRSYAFDGRDDAGRDLGAGGYFVRFENNLLTAAKKIFLVR